MGSAREARDTYDAINRVYKFAALLPRPDHPNTITATTRPRPSPTPRPHWPGSVTSPPRTMPGKSSHASAATGVGGHAGSPRPTSTLHLRWSPPTVSTKPPLPYSRPCCPAWSCRPITGARSKWSAPSRPEDCSKVANCVMLTSRCAARPDNPRRGPRASNALDDRLTTALTLPGGSRLRHAGTPSLPAEMAGFGGDVLICPAVPACLAAGQGLGSTW